MFSAYSEEEIYWILEARVGHSVVDPKALQFIAKKVESSSGDARKALEMAATAIQLRLKEIEELDPEETQELDSAVGPLVKVKHAAVASKDEATNWQDRISGLPLVGKMILCVMSTLTQAKVCKTTFGELKRFVSDCLTGNGLEDEMVGYEDFLTLVSTLVDGGLLRASSNASHDEIFDPTRVLADVCKEPIYLAMQQEDVEKALSRELKQAYFHELRKEASQRKL